MEALYSAIATRQCRSIVGERKMGKSSLLTQLTRPEHLREHGLNPEQYIFLYIDLEGMANIHYDEFWPEVIDQLELALPSGQEKLKQMVADTAMSTEIRFTHVRRLLRRIEREGITLVMMLDEFESLARNAEFDASFYGELRSLAGELGVVYLTISKASLYELTYQNADTLSSPFFNIFSEERLNLLPEAEARGLIQKLVTGNGSEPLTEEQLSWLVNLAGTHPFFLQVAGFHLYQEREEKGEKMNLALVEKRFRAEAEDHFRYLWSQLGDDEQINLKRLSIASWDALKIFHMKALVRKDGEGFKLFSQAFADFVERMSLTERPTKPNRMATDDLTGITIGSYRVLNPIGRGGMAVVYKAYQSSLDRYVAIKVMTKQLAGDPLFVERFQREASSVARLRHQHIVQMVDFGLYDGLSYMVMEYIAGMTLKDKLNELRSKSQQMSLSEASQIIKHIASALDYAHAHNIIHRDVKPANILLRPEEQLAKLTGSLPFTAVLADFGVARMLEGVQITQTGVTVGTPDYMAPEQASGSASSLASDIYALGIVLYEMLTNELPFRGETPVAVIMQHLQADPPSVVERIPTLPYGIDDVLGQAMAKKPEERFLTAGAMAEALHKVSLNGRY